MSRFDAILARSGFWRTFQRQRRQTQAGTLEADAWADALNVWSNLYAMFDRGPGVVYIHQKREEILSLLAASFLTASERQARRRMR